MASSHTLIDDQALGWLVKLNSGNLAASEQEEFWAWLNASANHQAAYIRAEALWQRGDIVAKLTLKAAPKPSVTPWMNWAVACSLFLIFVATGIFAVYTRPTQYHLVTAIGEQRQTILEDGTQVMLNTNSQLDVEFTEGHRVAKLTHGEVYFDVQADPKRPFDVQTDLGMVRVLGTHFAVNRHMDDVTVTVVEGRVALGKIPVSDQAFTPVAELIRNQQLSLRQAYAGSLPVNLNVKAALAWRDKQLVFQKQKLGHVVTELNRYFASEITLSPELADRDITAVIQLGEFNTTLAALCQPLNLQPVFDDKSHGVKLIPLAH